MADRIDLDLDRVTVTGTPREMGRQLGEALKPRIRAFMDVRFAYFTRYAADRGVPFAEDRVTEIGRQSMAIAAAWDPEGHAEHLGIAEGAGLDPVVLYIGANMTDMRDVFLLSGNVSDDDLPPDAEGCTSLLVPPAMAADGKAVVGQTWDLNAADVEYVVAVNRKPKHGVETWSVTCAGCLTLVGINARGLSVGTTNIKTWGARPGVGYLTILHRIVRAGSAKEAAALVEGAPRAGAHTYWIADAEHQLEVEAAPHFTALRDAGALGPICRTNHCVDPALVKIQGEPTHESSATRFARVTRSLAEQAPHTVETVKGIFSDRRDGALSVNRYPEDGDYAATNAVFVSVPADAAAWACRGPADRGIWYRLRFGA